MAGFNGLLDLGLGALIGQRGGVSAAGRNLANVNTPGYRREEIDLASLRDGGVRIRGMQRLDDAILASRERVGMAVRAHAEALARALESLELGMGSIREGLVDDVSGLFAGFVKLQGAPSDPNLREEVIRGADALATRFHQAAAGIADAQDGADKQIVALAKKATELAHQVAEANRSLHVTPDDPIIADQRDKAAEELVSIMGGRARIDADGQMRILLENGAALVDGAYSTQIRAAPDVALDGHVRVDVIDGPNTIDVTGSLGSGTMGGLLTFRDGVAADAAARLDQLAFDLGTRVNEVHQDQVGLDGGTGRDFFVAPTQVDGAAAAFAVDPALLADHRILGSAAAGGGPGDTTGLVALAAVGEEKLAVGGTRTAVEEMIALGGDLGAATQAAKLDFDLESSRMEGLKTLRDALSGVSPEEELTRLTQFQRAHEAATRFIQSIDEMLGDLLSRV